MKHVLKQSAIGSTLRTTVDSLVVRMVKESLETLLSGIGSDSLKTRRAIGSPRRTTKRKITNTTTDTPEVTDTPDETEKNFLTIIRGTPGISGEELRKVAGVDRTIYLSNITSLKKAGKIRTKGERRGTQYFLKD